MLCRGLGEWGGPARCTEPLAVAMGFRSVADLLEEGRVLRARLHAGEPLTPRDWRRTVLSVEIVFVSDVVGSGWDWSTTTGFSDEETIRLLRSVQRKIARALHSG
ncbi:hypothetical protein PS9374_07122 [Planomonospora sphaerica]|uniref:Uncharacterized protein n=1 Tax=Planomonospora sphaerica TaxID=161355 RepID=A0A171DQU5_9ACTN|nr:hypothetical protein PS9374_07122 [Planomonospora sphaerica]